MSWIRLRLVEYANLFHGLNRCWLSIYLVPCRYSLDSSRTALKLKICLHQFECFKTPLVTFVAEIIPGGFKLSTRHMTFPLCCTPQCHVARIPLYKLSRAWFPWNWLLVKNWKKMMLWQFPEKSKETITSEKWCIAVECSVEFLIFKVPKDRA